MQQAFLSNLQICLTSVHFKEITKKQVVNTVNAFTA